MKNKFLLLWRAWSRRKRCAFTAIGLGGILLCALILIDQWIEWAYDERVFNRLEQLSEAALQADGSRAPALIALVLGTSRIYDGHINRFYIGRIQAAADLFHTGKVQALIVSGDNSRVDYNEPELMKQDLIEFGVPEAYITCDYAGFSTLDSIHRIEKVFQKTHYLIISQDFHVRRALYIADSLGHQAMAFAAPGPDGLFWLKVRSREVLARAKAFIEVAILHSGPHFLGDSISVNKRIE